MGNILVRPYKMNSKGARLLRDKIQQLLNKRVLLTNRLHFNRDSTIINWGSDQVLAGGRQWNPSVWRAINKHETLKTLSDWAYKVRIPEWTTSIDIARGWVKNGSVVYCRTLVNSFEGKGIVIAKREKDVVQAPLYTKRFPHSREYRVHVAFGEVIQVVQKKRRNGANDADPRIRSNHNWVFARNLDHPAPECVVRAGVGAVQALGLDFGAVDVLYSIRNDSACVLEVNTAPGIDNISALIYAEAFVRRINNGN